MVDANTAVMVEEEEEEKVDEGCCCSPLLPSHECRMKQPSEHGQAGVGHEAEQQLADHVPGKVMDEQSQQSEPHASYYQL